ncbi:MAG: alpha-galactosidase [Bacilli bacterium]
MENTYIHLTTDLSSYVLMVNNHRHLENLYYGSRLSENEDLSILINKQKNLLGTSTNYRAEKEDVYCLDFLNLEVGAIGKGDYRKPSILIEHSKGYASDFIVKEHGFAPLSVLVRNELPIPHGSDQYFYVLLEDVISGVTLKIDYLVFKKANVIARRYVLFGNGQKVVKASSFNLDLDNQHFEIYSTYGTWANEMHPVRHRLVPGVFEVSTNAGPSSNRHNPFFLLLNEDTSLDQGVAYGFNLLYSGPFKATAELTFANKLRLQHGINDETFSSMLIADEPFITPFSVMTFSADGENGVSAHFHDFVKGHVVRQEYADKVRPILLNNWEATYFDFTEKKIKDLMVAAKQIGIELFVLDDGWFNHRHDDYGGLGYYDVNMKKLPHGLKGLSDFATKEGLQFGLWFEPEMVSADHDIFKTKPSWVVQIPGVTPSTGRFQYALNLALDEVVDYIISNVKKVLDSADIRYVKWDYNRNLSDFYTATQAFSTFFYDYTRGLYRILDTLTKAYPHILWEGCASGGNRFALGVLSFFDQIWVSDCSDAYERIRMHTVLAKAYPLSVMSGHVSAVPNHQMLRDLPLQTRFNNAFMTGGFGYELDVTKLLPKEVKALKTYNGIAKLFQSVVVNGRYRELRSNSAKNKTTFGVIAPDQSYAIVLISNHIHSTLPEVSKLPAIPLDEEAMYEVYTLDQATDITRFGSLLKRVLPKFINYDGTIIRYLNKRKTSEELIKTPVKEKYVVSGVALKAGALTLYPEWTATGVSDSTRILRDFGSILYFITKKDEDLS